MTGMRRRLLGCLTLSAALLAPAYSAAQTTRVRSDQEALTELEHQWNDAVYRQDADFVASVLADEFVATYEDGSRGDKASELELVRTFNQYVESAIQDDFTIRVYGDTAIVWFTLHLTGVRQGQHAEVTLRFTDVFVFRDTRWQCVSSQSTKVTPA